MAYTPFIERNTDKIAGAIQKKQVGDLSSSAYMGDDQALQQLYGVNPQLAERITMKRQQSEQQRLAQQAAQKKSMQADQDIATELAKQTIGMSLEEANSYIQRESQARGLSFPAMTQEHHDQFKKAFGKSAGGAFEGTGMDAQVSNMLSRGVDDPTFRGSPEYARAWELANEPKVIRTPTGDILHRPEIDPIFRPPSAGPSTAAPTQVEAKTGVEVVEGTEREIKTTAGEKTAYGYYNRMLEDERIIDSLGDFDASSTWERLKGVTNYTSSPDYQKYMQASMDWARAKLRHESGAVISVDEAKEEALVYFPRVGDGEDVIEQKRESRQIAMDAMKVASGKEIEKQSKAPTGYAERRARLLGGQ